MSYFKSLVTGKNWTEKHVAVQWGIQLEDGLIDHRLSKDSFEELLERFSDRTKERIFSFENRIFIDGDMKFQLGNNGRRMYWQEKQLHTELHNNFVATVHEKETVDRMSFPIQKSYDCEYSEKVSLIKYGPLTISLSDSPEEGRGVKISFKLVPLREEYIHRNLVQALKLIEQIVGSNR